MHYSLKSLAPVMIVEAVEPSLKFWTEQLGFAKDNEVPGPDGKLIFASVKKDDLEIKNAPVVKKRHDTFYGTTEFYIREPGGNVVGFAAPKS